INPPFWLPFCRMINHIGSVVKKWYSGYQFIRMSNMVPTEQRRSVSEVRDAVLDYLKRSGIGPGERIPTERKLQEILGVSRNRVRDALAALESQGTVKRLIGNGTYFQAPPAVDHDSSINVATLSS